MRKQPFTWHLKKFNELDPRELYAILQLRNLVFAVEQNCVYPDMDDKDQASLHLLCWKENELAAYSRIIPPGLVYPEASLGRVVTASFARRTGLGKELMQRTLAEIEKKYGGVAVRIGAQCYLQEFYDGFGFRPISRIYLEDGIEHIEMKRG